MRLFVWGCALMFEFNDRLLHLSEEQFNIQMVSFLNQLYKVGPSDSKILESLAVMKYTHPSLFAKYENKISLYLGAYFKDTELLDLFDLGFNIYKNYIEKTSHTNYNPIQYDIVKRIEHNDKFSFSAGTSIGKSFVLRNIIDYYDGNVCIIVPSRALINEYISELTNQFKDDNRVLILPFVEHINKEFTNKYIFILTPERTRDLFRLEKSFNVELFLFDEAQLTEEDTIRGLVFDSIVRRIKTRFLTAKIVFSHPFVMNPEAQFKKHGFQFNLQEFSAYQYGLVGQLFFSFNDDHDFKLFTVHQDSSIKVNIEGDPIIDILNSKKTILIYGFKTRIRNGELERKYSKYVNHVMKNETELESDALRIVSEIEKLIGTDRVNDDTQFTRMMKKRVIVHHGSMPLEVRFLIEEFVKKGYSRICFATSTLNQGINMPFAAVILEVLSASNPLLVKNLIGRAGRTSRNNIFDIGCVFISESKIGNLTKSMKTNVLLKEDSFIDKPFEAGDAHKEEDYKEFKESIQESTMNDEFNLPESTIERLTNQIVYENVERIMDRILSNDLTIKYIELADYITMTKSFEKLYEAKLGRELETGESRKFNQGISILIHMMRGRDFKAIVSLRYNRFLKKNYLEKFHAIPNRNLKRPFPITPVPGREYDEVVYDTYDYIDNLIGFTLHDAFVTAFSKYNQEYNDARSETMVKLIKYGTSDEKKVMLKRYGFSDEEINWIYPYVIDINEDRITFSDSIQFETEEKLSKLFKYR